MTAMKISSKGWVVIPKRLRERYGLRPGAKVQFVEYGGVLAIIPVPADPVDDGFGMVRETPGGRSLTAALLEERSRERDCERDRNLDDGEPERDRGDAARGQYRGDSVRDRDRGDAERGPERGNEESRSDRPLRS